jgi:hypothetical protein
MTRYLAHVQDAHDVARRNVPVSDSLHPQVYKMLIGLAIWLILSVWTLFDRGPYMGLTLSVVTGFILIAVSLPIILWLTWRNGGAETAAEKPEEFRHWISHEFATCTGTISGSDAAMQILLPIAAVAIGMTSFGLAFRFAVPQLGY